MVFKKKVDSISSKKKKIPAMDGLRDYVGKTIFSKSGDPIGKVHDMMISGSTFEGIIIMTGYFSRIFISREYISSFTKDAVMLSINPVTMMIGKAVFDADGKKLGKVKDVKRKTDSNKYEYLLVKKFIFSKPLRIPRADVAVAKKNIILKKAYV